MSQTAPSPKRSKRLTAEANALRDFLENVGSYTTDLIFGVPEGKRLYQQMNCVGCHFHGGGGIGPPLMDARWIYGSDPAQIFSTIVQGRPNGMPAFRGKLNDEQVWKLAAYVRSMSGQLSANVASSRDEHMMLGSPENSRPRETPVKIAPPPDVLPLPATQPGASTAPTTRSQSPAASSGRAGTRSPFSASRGASTGT